MLQEQEKLGTKFFEVVELLSGSYLHIYVYMSKLSLCIGGWFFSFQKTTMICNLATCGK
jgi:hypothetical protein